ncbi:hypothetical protein [Streptosporangium sp. NPDC049644]|uniref:hypothetical protein n=1 Tax=Streptosporangium sp. NPDC049644 TaxID=3155507 RepID=UPI0034261FFD
MIVRTPSGLVRGHLDGTVPIQPVVDGDLQHRPALRLRRAGRAGRTAGQRPPRALAEAMHGAWGRFARDGDPGRPGYDRSRRQVMIFDTESEVADDPLRPQRHLLREP